MFVKNSILALKILEKQYMSLRDPHCKDLDRLCRICGHLLGKKTLAKEKDITRLKVVPFINITKIYSTISSQDMHEILSSYDYGIQEKYKTPYFT